MIGSNTNTFSNKNKALSQLKAFLPLVLLGLVFTVLSRNFLMGNNLITILQQSTNIAILAYAETMVIITGGIDLSLGSILGVSGVVVGKMILAGVPVWVSVLAGVLFGGFLGFINGFVISRMNLIPFIATLGMQNIARGIAYVLTNSLPVSGLDEELYFIGGGNVGGIPVPVIIMFVLALLFAFIMKKTSFGRKVYAIGSNREAARLSGITVKNIEMWVFIIGGLLAGLVGVILASRVLSSQPNAGIGYESDAIAAVFIGGTSPLGGSGTILGTVIGALTIAVLKNGLNLLQVNAFWQQIAIGVVIIVAVYVDNLRRKK